MGHPLGRALFEDPDAVKPSQPRIQTFDSAGGGHGITRDGGTQYEKSAASHIGISASEYIVHTDRGERWCGRKRHWFTPGPGTTASLCRDCKHEYDSALYARAKERAKEG